MAEPSPLYFHTGFIHTTDFVICAHCGTSHRATDYTYIRFMSNIFKGRDAEIAKISEYPPLGGAEGSIQWSKAENFIVCNTNACLLGYFQNASVVPPILVFDNASPKKVTVGGAQIDIIATGSPSGGTFQARSEKSGNTNGTWSYDADFENNGQFSFSGYTAEGIPTIEIAYLKDGEPEYARVFSIVVESA